MDNHLLGNDSTGLDNFDHEGLINQILSERKTTPKPQEFDPVELVKQIKQSKLAAGEEDLNPVANWIKANPYSAKILAKSEEPSRTQFKKAGLPKMNSRERAEYVQKIRKAFDIEPTMLETLNFEKPLEESVFKNFGGGVKETVVGTEEAPSYLTQMAARVRKDARGSVASVAGSSLAAAVDQPVAAARAVSAIGGPSLKQRTEAAKLALYNERFPHGALTKKKQNEQEATLKDEFKALENKAYEDWQGITGAKEWYQERYPDRTFGSVADFNKALKLTEGNVERNQAEEAGRERARQEFHPEALSHAQKRAPEVLTEARVKAHEFATRIEDAIPEDVERAVEFSRQKIEAGEMGFLAEVGLDMMENAPNVIFAVGGKVVDTVAPGVGSAIASGIMMAKESRGFVKELEPTGVPVEFAFKYADGYGVVSGMIEHSEALINASGLAGGAKKAVSKKLLTRIIKKTGGLLANAGMEGLEEGSQQALQYVVMSQMAKDYAKENPDYDIGTMAKNGMPFDEQGNVDWKKATPSLKEAAKKGATVGAGYSSVGMGVDTVKKGIKFVKNKDAESQQQELEDVLAYRQDRAEKKTVEVIDELENPTPEVAKLVEAVEAEEVTVEEAKESLGTVEAPIQGKGEVVTDETPAKITVAEQKLATPATPDVETTPEDMRIPSETISPESEIGADKDSIPVVPDAGAEAELHPPPAVEKSKGLKAKPVDVEEILFDPKNDIRNKQLKEAKTKKIAEIDRRVSALVEEIEDWSSRVYKTNTKTVFGSEKQGGIPTYAISVGKANENRRNRAIESRRRSIASLKSWRESAGNLNFDKLTVADMELEAVRDLTNSEISRYVSDVVKPQPKPLTKEVKQKSKGLKPKPKSEELSIVDQASEKVGFPLQTKKGTARPGLTIVSAKNGEMYKTPRRITGYKVIDSEHAQVSYTVGREQINEIISISRIQEPSSAAAQRVQNEQLAKLEPAKRKQVKADAKEFDDIIMSNDLFIHGRDFEEVENQVGDRNKALALGKRLNQTRVEVAEILGDKDLDMKSAIVRADSLKQLKEYIDKKDGDASFDFGANEKPAKQTVAQLAKLVGHKQPPAQTEMDVGNDFALEKQKASNAGVEARQKEQEAKEAAQKKLDDDQIPMVLDEKRSGKEIAKSAANNASTVLKELGAALDIMIPKDRVGMGATFDLESFEKVKPHLSKAYKAFKATGQDVKEFSEWVASNLGEHARSYAEHFAKSVQATSAPEEYTTSLKKSVVNQEREAEGKSPEEPTVSESFPELDRQAKERIKASPTAATALVEELKVSPRPVTAVEVVMLLNEKVARKNAQGKAQRAWWGLPENATSSEIESAEQAAQAATKLMDELSAVVARGDGQAVTEGARALRAWGMLKNDRFEIVSMKQEVASAQKEPVTPRQEVELGDMSVTHERATQELEAEKERLQTEKDEVESELAEMRELADLQEMVIESWAKGTVSASMTKIADRWEAEAKATLAGLHVQMTMGPNPVRIAALTKLGASYVMHGSATLASWSEQMGDYIKGMSESGRRSLYAQAVNAAQKQRRKNPQEKSRKAKSKGVKETKESVMRQMFRTEVELGFTDIHEISENIRVKLDPVRNGITVEEIRREFGNYPKKGRKVPKRPDADKLLIDLRRQSQLLSHIDRVARKLAPLRIGTPREKVSHEQRKLTRKLHAMMKDANIVVTDPETQLANSLTSERTRLRYRIEDLQKAIDSRQRIVKSKEGLSQPSTPETEALLNEIKELREKRGDLQTQYNSIFKKPGLTDQQRANIALKHAERSRDNWDQKLKEAKRGLFSKKKPKEQLPDGKTMRLVHEVRKARDRSKEEVKRLKEIAFPSKTPEQKAIAAKIAGINRSIARRKDMIERNDFSPKQRTEVDISGDPVAMAKAMELAEIEIDFALYKEKARKAGRSFFEKWVKELGAGILDARKSLMAMWDQSVGGRQLGPVAATHPLIWAEAMKTSYKAVSPKESAAAWEKIKKHPDYKYFVKAGVPHSIGDGKGGFHHVEDLRNVDLMKKFPGHAASTRTYGTGANQARWKLFLRYGYKGGPVSEKSLVELKRIAADIGTISGSAKGMEKSKHFLVRFFWAPSFVKSGFELAYGAPLWRAKTKQDYARAFGLYAKLALFQTAVYGLESLTRGDDDEPVEWNPTSSKWGVAQRGNVSLSSVSLVRFAINLATILATGTKKNKKGKVVPVLPHAWKFLLSDKDEKPRWDSSLEAILGRASMSKFHPWVNDARMAVNRKDYHGDDATWMGALKSLPPIELRTMWEVIALEDDMAAVAKATLAAVIFHGVSAQLDYQSVDVIRSRAKDHDKFLEKVGKSLYEASAPSADDFDRKYVRKMLKKMEWSEIYEAHRFIAERNAGRRKGLKTVRVNSKAFKKREERIRILAIQAKSEK